MAPKNPRPSTFLKKCSITVIGSLGKDAKVTDVEKWTVNNGGTFKTKVDGKTTHLVCTKETFKKDDFALSKDYSDLKRLQIVDWAWLYDTLQSRRVKPAKKYVHINKLNVKSQKKSARRRAFLIGKTEKEVEREEAGKKKFDLALPKAEENDQPDSDGMSNSDEKRDIGIEDHAAEDSSVEYNLCTDDAGIVYKIDLKGAELLDPEDGDYVLSIVQSKDLQLYKACWEYSEGEDDFINGDLVTTNHLEIAFGSFQAYLGNKTGKKWSDYHACLIEDNSGVDALESHDEKEDDTVQEKKIGVHVYQRKSEDKREELSQTDCGVVAHSFEESQDHEAAHEDQSA